KKLTGSCSQNARSRRDQQRACSNFVLIVAVSMGSERQLLGYPVWQFLSSRSLVLGAPLLRFECSASEVSNKNFPGLISKLVDRAVENSFLRAYRGVLI